MQTVENIIQAVYGTDAQAAERHGVVPTAVNNWKARGCFPAQRLPAICQHARERGVELDVTDIPIQGNVRAAS